MLKFAVIVAGGSGQRMGTPVPKQFLTLQGKPLLWHTLHTFLNSFLDLQIILVLPAERHQEGEEIITSLRAADRVTITTGGSTRFDSVKNGLALVQGPSVIFVHDGVRCLVSEALIRACYEQALEKGSAIPAVAATDSIRIVENDTNRVANRDHVRIIQTPQTFKSELLLPAFERAYDPAFTDEATVVELSGHPVHLIEGDHQNIKITRPVDLLIAEQILQQRNGSATA